MKTTSEKLISELIEITRQNLNFAESLKQRSDAELNWKQDPQSWSILECLEHLNLYGDFYLPAIQKKISNSTTKSEPEFRSGLLGNYFAQMMLPKEKLNRMKTFKDKDPLNSKLNRSVIARFIVQQKQLIALLDRSRSKNLNREKIAITLSKYIKLKLGDTFRFVIFHNIRHIKQIERVTAEMKNSAKKYPQNSTAL